ncbi:hypothetical protein K3495_g7495 [Podosphaera aphanis]|nr:hypothetical protein K3495_g7495 [Podosphaera aphanis]
MANTFIPCLKLTHGTGDHTNIINKHLPSCPANTPPGNGTSVISKSATAASPPASAPSIPARPTVNRPSRTAVKTPKVNSKGPKAIFCLTDDAPLLRADATAVKAALIKIVPSLKDGITSVSRISSGFSITFAAEESLKLAKVNSDSIKTFLWIFTPSGGSYWGKPIQLLEKEVTEIRSSNRSKLRKARRAEAATAAAAAAAATAATAASNLDNTDNPTSSAGNSTNPSSYSHSANINRFITLENASLGSMEVDSDKPASNNALSLHEQ